MKTRVREAHVRSYEAPIVAQAGDRVRLGRRDDDAPDWIWVEHEQTELTGWAPVSFLEIGNTGDWAICKRDYAARELTVENDQLLETCGAVAGWTWCRAMDGQEGWVPSEKLLPPSDRGG